MKIKDIFPDTDPSESKSKNGNDKTVRVMQLVNIQMEAENMFLKDLEEYDSDDEDEKISGSEIKNHIDRSIIFSAYEAIDEAGAEGLSAREFRRKLNLTKLDARSQLKHLERRNFVDAYMKDNKRWHS